MDRLFLDANILFSVAYSGRSGLARLWSLPGVELLTSRYAMDEAKRNLDTDEQQTRLAARTVRILEDPAHAIELPVDVTLRPKDRPILAAAIAAGASHLLTGDLRDFGPYMGKRLGGVLVMLPGDYLRGRPVE